VQLRWIEVVCSIEAVHCSRIGARGVDIPGFYAVSWSDVLRRRTETDTWTDERLVLDTAVTDDHTLLARAVAHVA